MIRAAGTLALVMAFACASPGGARAAAGHHDNVASAVTETDGSRVADVAWGISRQSGGDVDQLNSATAMARCTDCEATAIAFQIVLVSGTPDTIAPYNRAVAVNDRCTRCVVMAEARQFVRVVEQPVKLAADGVRELADVRQDLRALASRDLSPAELHSAVEADEARVLHVLDDDLVPRSSPGGHAHLLEARLLQAEDAN